MRISNTFSVHYKDMDPKRGVRRHRRHQEGNKPQLNLKLLLSLLWILFWCAAVLQALIFTLLFCFWFPDFCPTFSSRSWSLLYVFYHTSSWKCKLRGKIIILGITGLSFIYLRLLHFP